MEKRKNPAPIERAGAKYDKENGNENYIIGFYKSLIILHTKF